MEELTLKQKFVSMILVVLFNGTPLIYGILRGHLMTMLLIFGIFGVSNTILEYKGKKNHAPDLWKIPDLPMCYITSNVLIILCFEAVHFGGIVLAQWQAVLLGVVACVIATLSISKFFYSKPKSENIETKKSLRDELAKMSKSQAKEYLYERLPEDEAETLYWLDYECKKLEFVAFNKVNNSVTVLKELRSSAYNRLRHINPSIE